MLKLPAIKTLARCRSANCNDISIGNAVGGTSRSACTTPDSSKNCSSSEHMTSLFPRLPILRSSKSAANLSTARYRFVFHFKI
uniref:Uncharacterized protein n=1 Tax=Romanomermis culicivorax TaxID=13658 RepID=A0A915KRP4_ROMCU